jgi:hypothetical protein
MINELKQSTVVNLVLNVIWYTVFLQLCCGDSVAAILHRDRFATTNIFSKTHPMVRQATHKIATTSFW